MRNRVGVDAEHPVARRVPQPVLERPYLAHPAIRKRVVAQEPDARIADRRREHEGGGTVGASAVHDENLAHDRPLLYQPIQAGPHAMRFVERRDDDAHGSLGAIDMQTGADGWPAPAAREQAQE